MRKPARLWERRGRCWLGPGAAACLEGLGLARPGPPRRAAQAQVAAAYPVCRARALLAAGPALTVSELVAALWPNRWLALLRRLTVLPFEGLLYLAWLAWPRGCSTWPGRGSWLLGLAAGRRSPRPCGSCSPPCASRSYRSLGALVRARAVRAQLHPGLFGIF
ncbi:uncharacterized protein LOC125961595 isoform X2 [Orcinus orca]|uniref:uncharacterized protein LOC125961595 isoform X2 n=1 Tax=Orcinus orca TaxID=9733 RepID=UPI002111434F|nr:uncharacterized protein LOC125961595 isoform X2 [Orcinus orca]XP_049556257.1 uncharacterized protein LOC125961595 isoform X2 [Orcinus orca]